ncbi:MAG: phosphatase [Lachnospiraceae bacterium]|nr:phosphatase [Lachnospiraceae bacterium]
MKYAIVDVGSNTIRLSVYQAEGTQFRRLFAVKERAGLANYIENDVMTREGILVACQVLNRFQGLLNQFPIDRTAVFATASLRNIENTEEAVAEIFQETGYSVDVVSGRDEGLYDFYGVLCQTDATEGLVFDVGGGSTEIVTFSGGQPGLSESMKIGCLNLFNQYVGHILPKKSEIVAMKGRVYDELERTVKDSREILHAETLCGVGGSVRAALKLLNELEHLPADNQVIPAPLFRRFMAGLCQRPQDYQSQILKICPDRIHTLIPGLIIMNTLVRKTECKEILINGYGIREGYLTRKVMPEGTASQNPLQNSL